jgi:hypothetical protein
VMNDSVGKGNRLNGSDMLDSARASVELRCGRCNGSATLMGASLGLAETWPINLKGSLSVTGRRPE